MTLGEGDSAVKIGQSEAILRYCGRVAGLTPEDPLEAARVDEMVQFINQDIRERNIGKSMRIEDADEKMKFRKELNDTVLPELFAKISDKMDDSGYLCNGKLSIADLCLYCTCSWIGMGVIDGLSADFIKANAKIAAHYKLISEIDTVAKWNSQNRAGKVPAF